MSEVIASFLRALGFFSRYPLPHAWHGPTRPLAQSAWALPLVGLLVALPASLALLLPGLAGPLLALGLMLVASGALHEDGWADVWDASGVGSQKRRLEVLKDPRLGAFGVMALALLMLVRWQGLTLATGLELIALVALSRGWVALTFQSNWLSGDGLGAQVGQISPLQAALVGVQLALLALLLPWHLILLSLLALLAMLVFIRRLLGGLNGDGLGALIIAAELGGWLGLMMGAGV